MGAATIAAPIGLLGMLPVRELFAIVQLFDANLALAMTR
tara:strand:- start:458 stop:574 length:117 start_codon:yes stop_codon:yes gene_type:complete